MEIPGAVPRDAALVTGMQSVPTAGGDVVPVFVARAGTEPRPAVIVLHEAMGLNDHIRDVASRFAWAGYVAVAPDLYHRVGPPLEEDLGAVLAKMFALPDEQVVADVAATAGWVRSQPFTTDRVGLVGFCAGGRWTLLTACTTSTLDAAIDCWGGFITKASYDEEVTPARPRRVIDLVGSLSCPLLAVFGAEDENPSPDVAAELEERLAGGGQSARVAVYPDAGHAFFADYRASYRPAAAAVLWDEMLEHFGRYLRGAVSR